MRCRTPTLVDELNAACCVQGWPVVCIAWGAWGVMGMAADNAVVAARLRSAGVSTIVPTAGLEALETVLQRAPRGGAVTMAAALVWDRMLMSGRERAPFYQELAARAAHCSGAAADSSDATVTKGLGSIKQRPAEAHPNASPRAAASPWAGMTAAECAKYFTDQIAAVVARTVGQPVRADEPLMAAGLDSLGEIRLLLLFA